jgi:hypothetical protein
LSCTVIPTPFTEFTSPQVVLDEIRYRNPGDEVTIG